MTRALDHIVWPTRNLGALAQLFRDLGFTVGRRNRHPWGTENQIIQFDGVFLELLGLADDDCSPSDDDPAFPFAGFCARYLVDTEAGAAMLVLRSLDAVADARLLEEKGLGHGRLLPFSRGAQGPDGSDRTVSFTIAFADLPGLAGLGTFLCEQHRPENFWNRAAQRHVNGATGIAGVTLRGPDPQGHAHVLRRFTGDASADPASTMARAGDCRIDVEPGPADARIVSVDIPVANLSAVAEVLAMTGIEAVTSSGALVVATPALGVTRLVFRSPDH